MKGRHAAEVLGAILGVGAVADSPSMITGRRLFDTSVPKRERKSPLPPGKAYAPHTGSKQRRRYQRQYCRPILKSKNPDVVAARERLREACAGEDDPEGEFLQITAETWSESQQENRPWQEIVNTMLDQFAAADAELEDGP